MSACPSLPCFLFAHRRNATWQLGTDPLVGYDTLKMVRYIIGSADGSISEVTLTQTVYLTLIYFLTLFLLTRTNKMVNHPIMYHPAVQIANANLDIKN